MWICSPEFIGEKMETLHKENTVSCKPAEHPAGLQNFHWLVRKRFLWKKETCCLKIAADDACLIYCNGVFVGGSSAQAYSFRYPYLTYDLTPYVRPGENVLAVHVYYMGVINRAYQSGDLRQGMWAQICMGKGEPVLETDASWRAMHCLAWEQTEVIYPGYDVQFQEIIDGAKLPWGWEDTGFDDSGWEAAAEFPGDDHVLEEQMTLPLSYCFRQPVHMEMRNGVLFCDMGEEVTGTVTLQAAAAGGGIVEVRCGEELNEDGTVRFRMRCNCEYRNLWKLSGRDRDRIGFFDYMAFRYFEIKSPKGCVDMASVGVYVRHYPMDEDACALKGDPVSEQIFDICRRAVKLGTQDAFLDCPSREKGQYLGDALITMHSHLLLTGDPGPYKKALLDFAASACICPGLMGVAPGGQMQEIADFSLLFPEIVLHYYELTGDRELVEGLMPVIDGLEDYFDRFRNGDGLLESVTDKWNLVDWPENLRDQYDFPLTRPVGPGVHNVINAFYYGMKKNADCLRQIAGISPRGEAEGVRQSYLRIFRRQDGLFRDAPSSRHAALHSNALPLYFGVVSPKEAEPVVRLIAEKGLCCGVYFAYFVLKGLARAGAYDLMNALLYSDGIHSWRNMLREGATTCFEAWGKEQKWNTSLCHPWGSAPVILLIEEVAGLKAVRPGFAEYAAKPHLPAHIDRLALRIKTVRGTIWAECSKEGAVCKDDFSQGQHCAHER